jgi:hypothetical protein
MRGRVQKNSSPQNGHAGEVPLSEHRLAPPANLHKLVVPEAPADADLDPCGHSVVYNETRNGKTHLTTE